MSTGVLVALITAGFTFFGAVVAALVAIKGQRSNERQALAAQRVQSQLNDRNYWKDVADHAEEELEKKDEKIKALREEHREELARLRQRLIEQRAFCATTLSSTTATMTALRDIVVSEVAKASVDTELDNVHDHEHEHDVRAQDDADLARGDFSD